MVRELCLTFPYVVNRTHTLVETLIYCGLRAEKEEQGIRTWLSASKRERVLQSPPLALNTT